LHVIWTVCEKDVRESYIGGDELTYLVAVDGFIHDRLGQSDDQFARIIGPATTTEARLVPRSL
jgi:hypothetical protein